jgi:disulfide oxidoreductase YuzD
MKKNKQQTDANVVEYISAVNQFAEDNNTHKPKQQTAVEWLVETLNKKYGNDDFIITFINEIEQAKEMEKEQIVKGITFFKDRPYEEITAEQYIKQTYGGNK